MKKFVLPFLLGVVTTLACIGILVFSWSDGVRGKSANCLPIDYSEYPSGKVDYQFHDPSNYYPYVFPTETPLKRIKDFYDGKLTLDSNWDDYELGHWVRNEVRPGEYFYECSAYLNWEELERGCIYLRERDGQTIVETIWLYSATNAPSCEAYMSELP